MKIGISALTTALDRLGGLSLRLANLIRGLAEVGHEVVVIQTKEALDESLGLYRSVAGLPVKPIEIDFRLGKGPFFWMSLLALWRLPVDRLVPDEIDVLDLWDPLVNVSRQRPYRVVFSHNHFTPYILQHWRNCGFRSVAMFLEIPFLHRMLRGVGKYVDGYVVETEGQRKWLIEKCEISRDLVVVVPPGFDAALVQSARRSVTENASPAIVFSGRLHKWKGVYELLEAFFSLAQEYADWNLHFVGDGPAKATLQEKVREKKMRERVIFWGRRDYYQTLQIVGSAEVFVLPSYIESFPLSLLEAMALGVPAIATDVGGIKDHLIRSGMTGLLVSPKAPEALGHALTRLISSPELCRGLGANGRTRAKGLTFERMVGTTVEFYERVLRGGRVVGHGSVRTDGSKLNPREGKA